MEFESFQLFSEIAHMSEQYIVSARKYRPQTFDSVVGQSHITTTLKNAIINQQLAHAYLFCGPRGVGKTTCARILARTINCENPTSETEACGTCDTCQAFSDNTAFNIFELDAASNNSVDDIRALTEQVRYAPQTGKYKIYIIDEVHMLSTAAFNAFLKTLEEPPSYAIFILATTEKHKILPTILSRCQIFDFKRITTDDTVAHLASICAKEQVAAEKEALHLIAQKSEGCMRDALSLMDRIAGFTNGQINYTQTIEHLNILDADIYFALTDIILSKDVSGALLQLEQILQKGFEGDVFLNGFAEYFRNLLLCKDKRMAQLLDLAENHKRTYFEKAQIIPQDFIVTALSIINKTELEYKNALNKRMHVELCLIRLCYLNDVLSTDNLSDALKKKRHDLDINIVDTPAYTNNIAVPNTINPTLATTPKVESNNEKQQDLLTPTTPIIATQVPQPTITPSPIEITVSNTTSTSTNNRRTKMSMDLLNDLHEEISNAANEVAEPIPLNNENIEKIFEDFIEYVKTSLEKNTLAQQLKMMYVKFVAPDEIQLCCSSEMNLIFGNSQRDVLLDYAKMQLRQGNIRVTAHLDPTFMQVVVPTDKKKSKLEIFEEMAAENEALLYLKRKLNLQVD
mgnify:CR=1 FL=1